MFAHHCHTSGTVAGTRACPCCVLIEKLPDNDLAEEEPQEMALERGSSSPLNLGRLAQLVGQLLGPVAWASCSS